MQNSHLHTPEECSNFVLMKTPRFSHKQAILILLRRVFLFNAVSSPFITGDLFVNLVDYAPWNSKKRALSNALRSLFLLESKKYKPVINRKKLRRAKSLFIPSHELSRFIEFYKEDIRAKIIFAGNSDFNFLETPKIPTSVVKCYLQNSAVSDEKTIFTLPIGLENLALGRAGLKRFHRNKKSQEIFDRVLIPPMSPTNKARYGALMWGRENPELADTFFELLPQSVYFDLAKKYKFVFCSEGNGFENHRIWETLYQGSFPILLSTSWSKTLKYLNLPILFVQRYSEITSKLLADFHDKNRDFDPKSCESLWEPYWRDLIDDICEYSNFN